MNLDPWRTESSIYLTEGPPYRIRRDVVSLPGGRAIDGYTVIETSPWVSVVAVTEADELVLVRQYRHALGRVSLELPGGGCEADEDPIVGGRRELLEETGFGDGEWRTMLTVAPNPALQDNWDHFVVATGVRRIQDPSPDETEDLVVELHPRGAVGDLVSSGEVFHALHVAALLAYENGVIR